jgi:hypothetical protein
MKLPEQPPSEIPIDQAIKNILLGAKQIPEWLPKPTKEKMVFETLWYFDKMTPEEIAVLDKNALGLMLSKLETEQQDNLVTELPPNLEKDFWDLIRKNDPMEQIDE